MEWKAYDIKLHNSLAQCKLAFNMHVAYIINIYIMYIAHIYIYVDNVLSVYLALRFALPIPQF